MAALPSLCAPGALVLWTRRRGPPDLTPAIRSWLGEVGFREEAFDTSPDGFMSVGAHRLGSIRPRVRLHGAKDEEATPAQIALAWLLAQRPWIAPIPGTRRLERLEENLGALEVQLTHGDLAAIDAAVAEITVVGARYPEAMQQMIDR